MSELWDKLDPGFISPIWLTVGALAVIAVVLLEIGSRRRRKQAVQLFAASHLVAALTASISPFKRLLKSVLLVSAVALLFTAMARPHLFNDWRDENRSGLDVLLAVDCSKSMLTEDVRPNRLERAKLAIADFAENLPDNRLGLIAFAGDAFLQCPMTLDHDAFQTAVRELDTDTIPRPGTDIATAIDLAVDALKSQPNNLKFLILVTDGEDLEGRVIQAAKNAAQSGLKIYTVGVGTPNGGAIPERDDSGAITYHEDVNGQQVVSKLDENTLRQIADITGGAYVPLGQSGEGLAQIYDRYIAPLPKQNIGQRREKIPLERFEWPLGLAILFLVWEFLINERKSPSTPAATMNPSTGPARRPVRRSNTRSALATTPLIAIGLLLFGAPGRAHAAKTSVNKAEEAYKAGQYEESLENYRKAAEEEPDRSDLQYDRGTAAYKAGEYTEAEDSFRKALETPDLDLQEKTYYNMGNSQFQHGKALQKVDTDKTISLWEQSLHSFDSALKLKTSPDAQHNYEIVKKKLEELKKQQQQKNDSSQSDQKDQSGKGSQQKNQGQGDQQNQNQSGSQNNSPDGQNPSQSQSQSSSGDKPDQNQQNGSGDKDKDQDQAQSSGGKDAANSQTRAYSGTRSQDKDDPGVKSRQEAEDLLDSLKDDERHVTARTLNALNGNQQPPPTASGKDW